jgi:predicted nucleotidyltransferase
MYSKIELDSICRQFTSDIQSLYGKQVSILLYGSAAAEEYRAKKSDINLLVVLPDESMENLDAAQKLVQRWNRRKILPLFMNRAYIESSLDSFPIEFLNMQSAYRVLTGEDVLASLRIQKKDLRLQCERELKGKLIQLRQGLVQSGGRKKRLERLITQSVVTFVAIFKGLLYLRGLSIPANKTDVILTACESFDEIERSLFETLLALRLGEIKKSKPELLALVKLYIHSIEKLCSAVDQIKV